ncbi:activated protein kinase catalytic subunit alpha-1 [Seminavis robusta]|uniref:Activated protein kinase catalytic subunit alpha-1 n=1 Tax=Seminavis robusta TaxID=568900 RepID=A0A9N8H389_9STRA|nr:activated protein kinase catalytic subunit alpha-1 [Seminavis robusta]|eukprot:Sro21_g015050.1 activated protein kinase catalytic subunit alpha-1 (413) ;mRNA; f:178295-179533
MSTTSTSNAPSRGAGLTFQDVLAATLRDPVAEEHRPIISRGETGTEAIVEPPGGRAPEKMRLSLIKSEDPERAYHLTPDAPKKLDHHAEGWGMVYTAVTFLRRKRQGETGLRFKAPEIMEAQLVAIKMLNKQVVNSCLERGANENPYKEIARMQELGDGIHVLQCIEALEDDTHLYIITPYSSKGSLMDNIPWTQCDGNGYPEPTARAIFINILEILVYLEKHGIYHHDLAPDNFLFFKGRLLLFDFAMSQRIPREEDGTRYLMRPQGVFGTMACTAPELFDPNALYFDGIAGDLWGAGTILYALLTGRMLYRNPCDRYFQFFVRAGGLRAELSAQILQTEHEDLKSRANANCSMPPQALELLVGLLEYKPTRRWTLMQAIESDWVKGTTGSSQQREQQESSEGSKRPRVAG